MEGRGWENSPIVFWEKSSSLNFLTLGFPKMRGLFEGYSRDPVGIYIYICVCVYICTYLSGFVGPPFMSP